MSSFRNQLFTFLFITISYLLNCSNCSNSSHQPIKNVVVLVLENRSFDHMLGWMKSMNPEIDGLTGNECNLNSTQDHTSQMICVSDDAQFVDPDPGHSFEEVLQQVFGSGNIPSMSGFVQQALSISKSLSNTVMKGFSPDSIPIYATLVKEFAVFDRWFSSIPGPTQPNRLFVYSATSHGAVQHDKFNLMLGYPQKTIFDSLQENGLDFGVYFKNIPTTLFYRNLRRLKYIPKFHWYSTFKDHARSGKLPSLSVIEPRYFDLLSYPGDDDHPSHDVANGQKLVKEVYEGLRSSPQWNQSLLIITYDEHGGFFDHVATPYKDIPNPDGLFGPEPFFFKFDRLGVRIPTIMVSPWIKKGLVVRRPNGPTPSSEFEHSSIPATIKKLFNIKSDFLTRRDAWAGTFEDIVGELTLPRTDCPVYTMSSNENSPVPSPEIINPPNVKIRIFNFPSGEWDENIADWIVQTCGGELTEVHNHRRTRGNELYYLCLAYVQDFSSIPDEIIYQSMYDGQFVVIRIEYKPIVM